ncbi:hypothetical protein MIND_01128200 [Mycena indigotica]|uniref:Uncharacterized protein n=1 Tax=Mycena indigotica TaxID=2126181 RepID=A0A8H6S830_9AGAR|nr:uncharacterized protein MIND_01128200 [Mycena indigotica]KAF7293502.1 hypothetical protein MIND_01128200 [Mycena indigotica]
MAPPTFDCTCKLQPFKHVVSTKKRKEHLLELEAFLAADKSQNQPAPSSISSSEIDRLVLETARVALFDHPTEELETLNPDPLSLMGDLEKSAVKLKKRKTQVAAQKSRQDLLAAISVDIQVAKQEFQSRNDKNDPWVKVHRAEDEIACIALIAASLQRVQTSPQKAVVAAQLSELETQLANFRAGLAPETQPLRYDTAYLYEDNLKHLHEIAQIMVIFSLVCNTILGLARTPVDFIMGTMRLIVKLAFVSVMSRGKEGEDDEDSGYGVAAQGIIDQLPTSLLDSMKQLELEGKTTLYAACPSCHHLYAPMVSTDKKGKWLSKCENVVVGVDGRSKCNTLLLGKDHRPLKPFLSPSFLDYLGRLLSNPEIEDFIEKANLTSIANEYTDSVMQGQLIQQFKGPKQDELFIKQPGCLPIAFSISVDYFPPRGASIHSSSASIGVLKLSCLNLPIHLRNAPENVYASILPGPTSPKGASLNPYLKPVIDVALAGWDRGIWLTKTAKHPKGRLLRLALPLSINDLLAARQLSGQPAHNHTIYCSRCNAHHRATVYRTDFNRECKSIDELRKHAAAWRDADTIAQQNKIYTEHGVRWSELFRLPYWNPTTMLVPDPMHTVLEGVVHYHCRRVLQIDQDIAKKRDSAPIAFPFDWFPLTPATVESAPKDIGPMPDRYPLVSRLQRLLQREIEDVPADTEDSDVELDDDVAHENEDGDADDGNDGPNEADEPNPQLRKQVQRNALLTEDSLREKLMAIPKDALIWVCWTLKLRAARGKPPKPPKQPKVSDAEWARLSDAETLTNKYTLKEALVQPLMTWRLSHPKRDLNYVPKPKIISVDTISYIQKVISETERATSVINLTPNPRKTGL